MGGDRDEGFDAVEDSHAEHLCLDGERDVRDGVNAVQEKVDAARQVLP